MLTCPECGRPQMLDHPAGVLTIQHTVQCTILRAEDATAAADHARLGGPFTRPATPTERLLLAALGHDPLEDDLTTSVQLITPSVRRRSWPELEGGDDAA